MYKNVKSVNFHNHPFSTILKGKSSLLYVDVFFFGDEEKMKFSFFRFFFLHFIIITVSLFIFFILLRSEFYHAETLLFYSTNDFIIDNLCKFHTIYQNIFSFLSATIFTHPIYISPSHSNLSSNSIQS